MGTFRHAAPQRPCFTLTAPHRDEGLVLRAQRPRVARASTATGPSVQFGSTVTGQIPPIAQQRHRRPRKNIPIWWRGNDVTRHGLLTTQSVSFFSSEGRGWNVQLPASNRACVGGLRDVIRAPGVGGLSSTAPGPGSCASSPPAVVAGLRHGLRRYQRSADSIRLPFGTLLDTKVWHIAASCSETCRPCSDI